MEEKKRSFFSCKYEDEPADLKLLLIYFIKRVRFIAYFASFGALLFASVYYMKTFVFVDEHQYVATSELYLIYADDVRLDNVYINDYTWQNLVHTDKAIDYAMEYIGDASVTEEYLKEVVWAGLESDVRFVTLKVTTDNPERSIQIAQAYQLAIKSLGEEMVDIDTVSVFTEADSAEEIVSDDRTLRMAITGAVIGGLLAMFGIVLQYVFDDSIYVAKQFEQRFGIPVLGICLKMKKGEIIAENMVGQKNAVAKSRLWGRQAIKLNYKSLTKNCKKIEFRHNDVKGINLLATVPTAKENPHILLFVAHYDTVRGTGGAVDNSSGTVTLLQMAKIFLQSGKDYGVELRFLFTAGEEQYFYGARNYVNSLNKADIERHRIVFNIDMSAKPNDNYKPGEKYYLSVSTEPVSTDLYFSPAAKENAGSIAVDNAKEMIGNIGEDGYYSPIRAGISDIIPFRAAGMIAVSLSWRCIDAERSKGAEYDLACPPNNHLPEDNLENTDIQSLYDTTRLAMCATGQLIYPYMDEFN